jgi:hypothetical protein
MMPADPQIENPLRWSSLPQAEIEHIERRMKEIAVGLPESAQGYAKAAFGEAWMESLEYHGEKP